MSQQSYCIARLIQGSLIEPLSKGAQCHCLSPWLLPHLPGSEAFCLSRFASSESLFYTNYLTGSDQKSTFPQILGSNGSSWLLLCFQARPRSSFSCPPYFLSCPWLIHSLLQSKSINIFSMKWNYY